VNAIDKAQLRISAITLELDRKLMRTAFEQALLNRPMDDEAGSGGDGDGDSEDGSREDARRNHTNESSLLSQQALISITKSVQTLGDSGDKAHTAAALVAEVAQAVRAGRRFPGDQWRLTARVKDEILTRTEIEIKAHGAQLSVILRTSSEDAYRQIGAALGRLNNALAAMHTMDGGVKVFLVSMEEIA
jgi:hypothetical protein